MRALGHGAKRERNGQMVTIQLLAGEDILAEASHQNKAQLYYPEAYPEAARLRVLAPSGHLWVQVDQAVAPALLYLPEGSLSYAVPQGEERRPYPPQAFAGTGHLVKAWLPAGEEIFARRNLAHNPADQRGETNAYPHASANVETRDESVFAARNVIDGDAVSFSHGGWPFQSWGIGARADAWLMVEFGREVLADEMALVLRADFPHDTYWVSGRAVLSDGSAIPFTLQKTGEPQHFNLGTHRISWLRLEGLVKSDEPSIFPSLTELEIYGRETD